MTIEIEVRATREVDGCTAWCRRSEAEAFSLYVGKPGSFVHIEDFFPRNSVVGAEVVAFDRAKELSQAWGVPFYNRIEE